MLIVELASGPFRDIPHHSTVWLECLLDCALLPTSWSILVRQYEWHLHPPIYELVNMDGASMRVPLPCSSSEKHSSSDHSSRHTGQKI